MRIIFLGTPRFVQPIKEELAKNFTLVDKLEEADLAVVAAYGQILTKEELEAPKYGCINIHPSLLPKYRGPSPIQSTILNGEKISGVTIIKMDEEIDHGPIIYQEELELSDKDNFDTLSKKMFLRTAEVLPQIIKNFIQRKITPILQNHSQASYCEHLTKETGYFDLPAGRQVSAEFMEKLDRMIKAYFPWPGVWTKWSPSAKASGDKQGKIVKFLPGGLLQMEGKKPISFKDFLNGYPDFPMKNLATPE